MGLSKRLLATLILVSAPHAVGEDKQALFGDLHVHTRLSMDAWGFGTRTSPDDAYRFAKGEALAHPTGFDMQLPAPLDFYGVTDHAMFLGVVPAAAVMTTVFPTRRSWASG